VITLSQLAFAGSNEAVLMMKRDSVLSPYIRFSKNVFPVTQGKDIQNQVVWNVTLSGVPLQNQGSLVWKGQNEQVTEKTLCQKGKEFSVVLPLEGQMTNIQVVWVDALGRATEEPIQIILVQRSSFFKKISTQLHFGGVRTSYSQPSIVDLAQWGWELGAEFKYPVFSPLWRLKFNMEYLGALVSVQSTLNTGASFLKFTGGVERRLFRTSSGWSLDLNLGFLYSTMFVSDRLYGIRSMNGFLLGPNLQKSLGKSGDMASLAIEYVPLMSGAFQMSLANYSILSSLSWTHPMGSGDRSLLIGFRTSVSQYNQLVNSSSLGLISGLVF
jgi:hypothetical protein